MIKIIIKELSQESADSIMKKLSGEALENFKKGFHDEAKNILKGNDHIWALPPGKPDGASYEQDKRIYYLISLNGNHYLFVGINPTPLGLINLSSFARIVSQPKCKAAICLKKLIEDKLVPMCRINNKKEIAARIATDRGEKVFQNLKNDLPIGIKKIEIINASCRMELVN